MIKSIKFFHSSNVIYPEGSRFGITIYLRDKDLKVLIKILMLAALLFCGALPARAQSKNDYIPPESENKPYRLAYYTDAQWVEFEGDSLPMYTLRRITVFGPSEVQEQERRAILLADGAQCAHYAPVRQDDKGDAGGDV